ncbi:MAG: type II toxin-antitoxin system RelE/ParE family toxin [Proteobacteria bacterium]|nr:type II toxin-antitoxin system RelE/ParE family toxin [Desulfobacteraceae bacterium]MBU3979722.1 type II toxin-antitoxin system RelE/ParE family toxin [Pseudomonadota bacterium]MBU4012889.1 type II toxin-antitoxin system RelE/ParE family toxin [Pseudomonadota bacterium]MBU4068691.1 type II toxin-antitoxin system RelE/ParE family toxin [Pseudomonadota bacterium]MBU4099861.1 type II toxin-antitoxin system RelE/ParE family toxin [Pseudomonadota bacterium]
MNFKITFTPEAVALLSKLHPESKKLIRSALKELSQNPDSGDDLQGELSGFKSCKPKRYRILYKIDEENRLIQVYYVGHRKDVYEQFRLLLNKLRAVE